VYKLEFKAIEKSKGIAKVWFTAPEINNSSRWVILTGLEYDKTLSGWEETFAIADLAERTFLFIYYYDQHNNH